MGIRREHGEPAIWGRGPGTPVVPVEGKENADDGWTVHRARARGAGERGTSWTLGIPVKEDSTSASASAAGSLVPWLSHPHVAR